MKKFYILFFLLVMFLQANSQTLINFYPFANYNPYNYFWGVALKNDTLWCGTDYDNTTTYPYSMLYKVTKNGLIVDSLTTPFKFNHGLAWDGTGFWIAEDYRTSGARIYKIDMAGQRMDSIILGTYAAGIGGIAIDGNNLWVGTYYPDFTSYPYAYAYKINLTTKLPVDTIPLLGKQVQGIAVKSDTIFYVTDNFQGDPERIYAYRKAVGDTLFSFPVPDPDSDCDPHGLLWDGQNLWLMAQRVGNNINVFRTLYKYQIGGIGNPQITTSTNTIDFGIVNIGTTSNQTLNISNTGSAKLIISGKNTTNTVFGITPNNVPDTILPGGNKNYTIGFTPAVFDTLTAFLQIASNDILTPVKTITLKGKGVYSGGSILLSATTFNYQQRRVNSTCGFLFTVTNQGNADLSINSMIFNTGRYRIDTNGIQFPYTITSQNLKVFRVWFNPNSGSTFLDTLKINSNAINLPVAKISFSGSGNTALTNLGDILWQGNTPDNPYTSSDDYQPTSIKQINDVNGDGIKDLIITSGNYYTSCWNGNSSVTGDLLWTFNTGYDNNNTGAVTWQDGMQIRDDVDGDGVQDVVIGCAGGNEMVYTISGRTGKQIWNWGDSITYSDGDIEDVRADKDFNGDGIKDVLVSASGTGSGTGGRHALVCLNGLTGAQIFYYTQNSDFTGDVTSTQFGGAIGNGSNSGAYSVKGFNNTGAEVWSYSTSGKVWSLREIPTINADTVKEVLGFFGFSSAVFCVDEVTGAQLWTQSFGSGNNGTIILLDDLDSNGYIDFTMSGPQGMMRIDSKTHNTLWQNFPAMSYVRNADILSDVNGDGKKDLVYGMQTPGNVLIVNGTNGQVLFTYTFGSTVSFRADRVAALNSIDGNSTTEIVAGCRDGRIVCLSGGQNNPVGIQPISNVIPAKYDLHQNYPNPFNPTTKIKFDIAKQSNAALTIYDISGKEVMKKNFENLQAGVYEYAFDGSQLSSGVYFAKFNSGSFTKTIKLMLLK